MLTRLVSAEYEHILKLKEQFRMN
jgi:superfamily I DNA and/or RNA helicase